MIVVGLTGGIGSGKSTVAALLAGRGAHVIDLDDIARHVAAPGGAAYDDLAGHFGTAVVRADGTLDRAAIATRVFSDPAELKALNAITHPAIAAVTLSRLAALADEAAVGDEEALVVLEIPLLTEATKGRYGLAAVVVVDAPVEVAVRRLFVTRGMSKADAEARARAQPSREDRLRLADVVIDNGGSMGDLRASVGDLWTWLGAVANE